MTTSTVIFTVLPNPTPSNEGLMVSVLVSPRLQDSGTSTPLGNFSFAARPWPEIVKAMGQAPAPAFTVSFNGGANLAAKLAPPRRPVEELDPELWKAIFPTTLDVRPWNPVNDGDRKLRSFPVKAATQRVLDLYKDTAQNSPGDFPLLYPAGGDARRIDRLIETLSLLPDVVSVYGFSKEEQILAGLLRQNSQTGALDFYQALRFYTRRPVQADGGIPDPINKKRTAPSFDFHRMLTLLSDHPTLMRKLGLVFDLIIPGMTLDTAHLPVSGSMRANVNWRGPSSDDKFPSTLYHYYYGQFAIAPRDWGNMDGAYMRLDLTDRFTMHQVDVDGATLKTVDFAVATKGRLLDRQQEPVQQTSLPALRSGGFTITQEGRATFVQAQMDKTGSSQFSDANGLTFAAEDLLRGFRIDAQKDGGQWQSLCRRHGQLTINRTQIIDIPEDQEEEGYVKAASGASNEVIESNGKAALYLHEAIAGWDGYSLCARRPGKTIVQTGDASRPEEPQHRENTPAGNSNVQAEYRAVRRSLPSLRFGHSYRLRARYVDVAGNGTPFTDTLDWHATPAQVYQRFEPIASPVLALRRTITEAESLEHMVIRSDVGMTPEQYAQAEWIKPYGYLPQNERHVLPPKTSQAMAEAHGMLDKAFTSESSARYYYNVARREEGTLLDAQVVDIEGGSPIDVSSEMTLNNPPGLHANQELKWPENKGDPLKPGQYVTYSGTEVRVPYLPDPLAIGMVLYQQSPSGTETGAQSVIMGYPYRAIAGQDELARWAEKRSLRVLLRGNGGDHIERGVAGEDAQSILFTLPQGQKLTLRMSSLIDPNRLEEMAIWHTLDASVQASLKQMICEGRHWMITPYRELVLVHAVQRPVKAPLFAAPPVISRDPGATNVRFANNPISVHGFSTSHVDVRAGWMEWLDVPEQDGPSYPFREADAFRIGVKYEDTTVSTTANQVTKERAIPPGAPIRYLAATLKTETRDGLHELGDTKHRTINYWPVGTTRYAEYFPVDINKDRENLENAGNFYQLNVKSTARPVAPVPLYIVPTFQWDTANDGTRTRRGGGIRIYLDRPWFSSGEGERLGIVLAPTPKEWPAWMSPFISQWGRDPIWSASLTSALTPASFRALDEKARWPMSGTDEPRILPAVCPLAERPDAKVIVMGVMPVYSEERKLWYCDVEFDIGTGYFPMLSLALVRYQKDSLDGLELSSVVRAEYTQIAPDRSATATVGGNTVNLKVWGNTAGNSLEWLGDRKQGTSSVPPGGFIIRFDPSHAGTPSAGHRVRARLEKRVGGAAAGDLAWSTVGSTDLMGEWKTQGTEALWTGALTLPAADGAEYRVVITESEMYESDNPGTPVFLGGTILKRTYKQGGERITYLDIVPVR